MATAAQNSEYWEERFEELHNARIDESEEFFKKVEEMYRQAADEIEKDIARWYMRLEANNKISLTEAKKLLKDGELEEFKWTLEKYIQKAKENGISADWEKQLENASAKYHISRLEALNIELRQHIEYLYGEYLDGMYEALRDTYQDGFYNTAYELQKGFETGFEIGQIDTDTIEKVLSRPWAADGRNFSDRIWSDKTKLINNLQNELVQSLIKGTPQDKVVKRFADRMNVSKTQAGRLIATETAYFATLGETDSMQTLGVNEYEILATLDRRTSDICRSLDGKVFKMSDKKPGVTAPPFHPWCRSCTIPHTKKLKGSKRAARDDGKTYYVPASMKYDDWKSVFVDKSISFKLYKRKTPESAIIKEKALAGEIKLTVNENKQARHDKSSPLYQEGKSYMTISMDEIQDIVNKYAGTGYIPTKEDKEWKHKESIILPQNIGIVVTRKDKKEISTNRITIHYSKTGVHVVPSTLDDEKG